MGHIHGKRTAAGLAAVLWLAAFPGTALAGTGQWQQQDGRWSYIQENGVPAAEGWLTDGGRTYYIDADGFMATGWRRIGGSSYYFHEDGGMNLGDLILGNAEYRFDGAGAFVSAGRVKNTGGGAFTAGCYDETLQALFDDISEEKREEYFDEYPDREDEYDGDENRAYDKNASFKVTEELNRIAEHRLAAAREKGYADEQVFGEGTLKDYLTSISYRGGRTCMEVYLQSCGDESEAYDKFSQRMMDRYEKKADRKYLPEYYREIGMARLEEGGKQYFMIIMMR